MRSTPDILHEHSGSTPASENSDSIWCVPVSLKASGKAEASGGNTIAGKRADRCVFGDMSVSTLFGGLNLKPAARMAQLLHVVVSRVERSCGTRHRDDKEAHSPGGHPRFSQIRPGGVQSSPS